MPKNRCYPKGLHNDPNIIGNHWLTYVPAKQAHDYASEHGFSHNHNVELLVVECHKFFEAYWPSYADNHKLLLRFAKAFILNRSPYDLP